MKDNPPIWQRILRRRSPEEQPGALPAASDDARVEVHPLDISPNDPFLAYVTTSPGIIDVSRLNLDSPTLEKLRLEGVRLSLPLVSQGELIGLLNLGARLSEQEYSSDDFRLLENLATQASPALRVAQLARQQLVEAQARERMEQELRVARVIQETLLPKEIPSLPEWSLATHWQPARQVGGDFYDFIDLPDGRLGILIADVTDKGVPAAMVMATTRSILRAASERLIEPGKVLARTNELLHPDIPARMFVTCLYLALDTASGRMSYANAGHNVPYLHTAAGIVELRATGMPLGLLPGMDYDQFEVTIQPGESVLLSSDGLVEAHNPQREMFGFPRVKELMGAHPGGHGLINYLLEMFKSFTGPDHEQEDDITLVTLERIQPTETEAREIGSFSISSEPGNEREAAALVLKVAAASGLPQNQLKRLETAVAEATMNAMEHGNKYRSDAPVEIRVTSNGEKLTVRIRDQGGGAPIPNSPDPNLEAKLTGEQSPRGWGLFLIKNMVDGMQTYSDESHHTIELVVNLKGVDHE